MLAVAFFPHRLNTTRASEATLSQELHTTRLLLLHVSVEYRWQHIGLSPVSRPNGYVCGFVSQSPKLHVHLSMHAAFQSRRIVPFMSVIAVVSVGVRIARPDDRFDTGPTSCGVCPP